MTAEPAPDSGQLMVKVIDETSTVTVSELEQALDIDSDALETHSDPSLESLDPVTIISFAISGAEMAHRLWKWWKGRQAANVDATLVRPDGTEVRFSNLTEDELLALVDRVLDG